MNRPATGSFTNLQGHNDWPWNQVLREFRDRRPKVVERLDGFLSEMLARTALHPRLNIPMRLVDMILFQAEHHDCHLARIGELARLFAK